MKRLRRGVRVVIALLCALMALLVGYGGWSLSRYGSRYIASGSNTLVKNAKENVTPGDIYDRNGTLLAGSDGQNARVYQGDEDSRTAVAHLLGESAKGAETFMTPYLYGLRMTYSERISYALSGARRKGDTLHMTVNAQLMRQLAAWWTQSESLGERAGAVVVLNYQTGEVLALSSFPAFDPSNPAAASRVHALDPYINRATRGLYAPGSTYKIVTLTAALATLPNANSLSLLCTGALTAQSYLSDAPGAITDAGGAVHGTLTLNEAFAKSCNNSFAQLALTLGDERLKEISAAFGMGDDFLFRDLVVENSVYPTANRSPYEVAWTGAGQSGLLVTPMHMALMTAAVANDGVMMEPRLLQRVVSQTGIVRVQDVPRAYREVISADLADALSDMMRAVVTGGTGTRAAVSGHRICGKTGTAQTGGHENAWFIGFIDEPNAPYALCVLVEAAESGGGAVAAPLAGQVFSWLLNPS